MSDPISCAGLRRSERIEAPADSGALPCAGSTDAGGLQRAAPTALSGGDTGSNPVGLQDTQAARTVRSSTEVPVAAGLPGSSRGMEHLASPSGSGTG